VAENSAGHNCRVPETALRFWATIDGLRRTSKASSVAQMLLLSAAETQLETTWSHGDLLVLTRVDPDVEFEVATPRMIGLLALARRQPPAPARR
jgi:hypothetical protein